MDGLGNGDFLRHLVRSFHWRIRCLRIGQGLRMPEERALAKVQQRAGRPPVALLIGAEHIALQVGADAAWRAQTAGDGSQLAAGGNHQAPATPLDVFIFGHGLLPVIADADVERDPGIALMIEDRTIGILVVIAGDTPALGERSVFIRHVIPVRVPQAGDLAALGGVKGTVVE